MVSEVLPDVPWVQMVFTIPKMLRPLFLWDRTLYGVFHPAPENLDFTPPLENLFREKLFKVLLRREKITEERVELLRLASWLCSRVPRFSRSPGGFSRPLVTVPRPFPGPSPCEARGETSYLVNHSTAAGTVGNPKTRMATAMHPEIQWIKRFFMSGISF